MHTCGPTSPGPPRPQPSAVRGGNAATPLGQTFKDAESNCAQPCGGDSSQICGSDRNGNYLSRYMVARESESTR